MSIQEAATLLAEANRLVVFTGAGISAESGIATFRDAGGVWEHYPLDSFGTPGGLARVAMTDPDQLIAFLLDVLEPIAVAEPNAGHRALVALEADRKVTVVTQNVDGLHQAAGSDEVHEVHGSLFQIVDGSGAPLRRLRPPQLTRLVSDLKKLKNKRLAALRLLGALQPLLGVGPSGLKHRPNVVLFGEQMAEPDWLKSLNAANRCEAMLVVGTSATVYPAAMLPEAVRERGLPIVGVGPEEGDADVWLEGTAAEVLPELAAAVGARSR
jgi:NAD-dependent deacetylase